MNAIDAFHAHLDSCSRCRKHPFDLCPVGAPLLKATVGTYVPKEKDLVESGLANNATAEIVEGFMQYPKPPPTKMPHSHGNPRNDSVPECPGPPRCLAGPYIPPKRPSLWYRLTH